MTNADIMRIYDQSIAHGGSANFVFLYSARLIIAATRKECADIVSNRQVAANWNQREALAKIILELPNSLNNIDFRKVSE
jgi:hypothetical protein